MFLSIKQLIECQWPWWLLDNENWQQPEPVSRARHAVTVWPCICCLSTTGISLQYRPSKHYFMPLSFVLNTNVLSRVYYIFLLLVIVLIAGLSCVALLSQAVRTAPTQDWSRNFNALVIGVTYSLAVCF